MAKSQQTRILVLDDEKLIRMTCCAHLKRAGYIGVPVATVDEAVGLLKNTREERFSAIITDIMMGDMDGFVFRTIVRGFNPHIPIFFLTGLDPEEGGEFLRRILEDPYSFYMPKNAAAHLLVAKLRATIAGSRVGAFVERQLAEQRRTAELASHVQRSLLPTWSILGKRGFYSAYWRPKEGISGDLYECVPLSNGRGLFLLGDIQGHGTSAALAMTAVQANFKQLAHMVDERQLAPEVIANTLQDFFTEHLRGVSYMTLLICICDVPQQRLRWLSCGAPDPLVFRADTGECLSTQAAVGGGVPIGFLPETVYKAEDVAEMAFPEGCVALALSDGIYDMSRDSEGLEALDAAELTDLVREALPDIVCNGGVSVAPWLLCEVLRAQGYRYWHDDVTLMAFGGKPFPANMWCQVTPLSAERVNDLCQEFAAWAQEKDWDALLVDRVTLVLEEALLNIRDHAFDDVARRREVVSIRIDRVEANVRVTIWDRGMPPPSLQASGGASVVLERRNREGSGRGRGRLIIRGLTAGTARARLMSEMNEAVYYIPVEPKPIPAAGE